MVEENQWWAFAQKVPVAQIGAVVYLEKRKQANKRFE